MITPTTCSPAATRGHQPERPLRRPDQPRGADAHRRRRAAVSSARAEASPGWRRCWACRLGSTLHRCVISACPSPRGSSCLRSRRCRAVLAVGTDGHSRRGPGNRRRDALALMARSLMRVPNVWRASMNLAGVRVRRLKRHGRACRPRPSASWTEVRRARPKSSRTAPAMARVQVHRGRAAVERAGKRVSRFDDHVRHAVSDRSGRSSVARSCRVGRAHRHRWPWTSEVGYEALYWLPFLRWAMDRYALAP